MLDISYAVDYDRDTAKALRTTMHINDYVTGYLLQCIIPDTNRVCLEFDCGDNIKEYKEFSDMNNNKELIIKPYSVKSGTLHYSHHKTVGYCELDLEHQFTDVGKLIKVKIINSSGTRFVSYKLWDGDRVIKKGVF